MGEILYGTGSSSTVLHATPECVMLNRQRTYPILEFTLATTHNRKLCRVCFPGQEGLTSAHLRCKICRQPMPLPCRHNGGVLVIAPQKMRLARRPGDDEGVRFNKRWVWPENVYRYSLAEPLA